MRNTRGTWDCAIELRYRRVTVTVKFNTTLESGPWVPTGMGKRGHLPSPGKVEKCYGVKKLHFRSKFERRRRCFSAKKDREWLFHNDEFSFLYRPIIKELCVVVLVF